MDNNEEVITDMKNVTINLLRKFFQANSGRKPEKLVMFRDGVSEGQVSTELLTVPNTEKKNSLSKFSCLFPQI